MPVEQYHANSRHKSPLNRWHALLDRVVSTHRGSTYKFYQLWRTLVLKLLKSHSLSVKIFGWAQAKVLVKASAQYYPPARSIIVSGAGCNFLNGKYEFTGETTPDGHWKVGSNVGSNVAYVRNLPMIGKKLTLAPCKMRSHAIWWFISEADEEQPGTDRDLDYYKNRGADEEQGIVPPQTGWEVRDAAGTAPAPTLQLRGQVAPQGEESSSILHQFVQWAMENNIADHGRFDGTPDSLYVAQRVEKLSESLGISWERPNTRRPASIFDEAAVSSQERGRVAAESHGDPSKLASEIKQEHKDIAVLIEREEAVKQKLAEKRQNALRLESLAASLSTDHGPAQDRIANLENKKRELEDGASSLRKRTRTTDEVHDETNEDS